MAKKKPVARHVKKNRQLKLTVDIPADYDNDEDFLLDLADKLDDVDWVLPIKEGVHASISKAQIGENIVEPE